MLRPGLLYFAYGCNMDTDFLAHLIGLALAPGWAARVDGWRLAFNKGGDGELGTSVVANLMEDDRCRTYGVVYRLPREALEPLDAFEQVPEHYRHETLWVEPLGHSARQAVLAYVGQPAWLVGPARPEDAYLDLLLRGAAVHGLPGPYVEWLRNLAAGADSDCYRVSG